MKNMIKIYALIVALSAPFTVQAVESTLSTYSMRIMGIEEGNHVSRNPSGNHTDIWVGFDNALMNKDSEETINRLPSKLSELKNSGSKLSELTINGICEENQLKKAEKVLRSLLSRVTVKTVIVGWSALFSDLIKVISPMDSGIKELNLVDVDININSFKSIGRVSNLEKVTFSGCRYRRSFIDNLKFCGFFQKESCSRSNTLKEWEEGFVDIAEKDSIRIMQIDQGMLGMINKICKGIMEKRDIAKRLLEGERTLCVDNTKITNSEQLVQLIGKANPTPLIPRFDAVISSTSVISSTCQEDSCLSVPHKRPILGEKLYFLFNNKPIDDHAKMEVRPKCTISIPELTINRMREKNQLKKAEKVLRPLLSRATGKTVNVDWSVLSPDLIQVLLPIAPSIEELNLTKVKIDASDDDLVELLNRMSGLRKCIFTCADVNENRDKMIQVFKKLAEKDTLQVVDTYSDMYRLLPKGTQDALLGNGRCIDLQVWDQRDGLLKYVTLKKDAQGYSKQPIEFEVVYI